MMLIHNIAMIVMIGIELNFGLKGLEENMMTILNKSLNQTVVSETF